MDVLQQAGEAVGQGDAERPKQVVPVGLHVLAGPALGVALTAHILMVRSHYVGDEVVVTTGSLEGERESLFVKGKRYNTDIYLINTQARCCRSKRSPCREGGRRWRDGESGDYRVIN